MEEFAYQNRITGPCEGGGKFLEGSLADSIALFHRNSILEGAQKNYYIHVMSETTEWIDDKYRQVYEEELRGLGRRKAHDPLFSVEDAQGILKNLYIMEGNDWTGRGQLQDATLSGTINAYEHFIAEWRKEGNE